MTLANAASYNMKGGVLKYDEIHKVVLCDTKPGKAHIKTKRAALKTDSSLTYEINLLA